MLIELDILSGHAKSQPKDCTFTSAFPGSPSTTGFVFSEPLDHCSTSSAQPNLLWMRRWNPLQLLQSFPAHPARGQCFHLALWSVLPFLVSYFSLSSLYTQLHSLLTLVSSTHSILTSLRLCPFPYHYCFNLSVIFQPVINIIFLKTHIFSPHFFFYHFHTYIWGELVLTTHSIKEDREMPLEENDNSQNKRYINKIPQIPVLVNLYKLIKLIWKIKCLEYLINIWKWNTMRGEFVLPNSNIF